MDPDASWFDNPEFSRQRLAIQHGNELAQAISKFAASYRRRQRQHNDSGSYLRWISQHVPEVAIKRDKGALLVDANVENLLVRSAAQPLIRNSHYIVTGCA